jgi:hypothetical protein
LDNCTASPPVLGTTGVLQSISISTKPIVNIAQDTRIPVTSFYCAVLLCYCATMLLCYCIALLL